MQLEENNDAYNEITEEEFSAVFGRKKPSNKTAVETPEKTATKTAPIIENVQVIKRTFTQMPSGGELLSEENHITHTLEIALVDERPFGRKRISTFKLY